ncbi:MAG: rhodanese-like domain-containing protein [Bacteroidales bacterium]|nr:rhodanese-like domain-containing protein [Bacteroidales bacterium]MDY5443458.1 rhodanese-like domain-containing protein [Candidatus Cryptobacteroides sp.]
MKFPIIMSSLLAGLFCWNCQAQPKFESLDNEGFAEVLKDTTVQLVDVRTPEEFAEGHIPDALNINVMDENFIDLAISSLDRKRTVAVYCRSGRRSKTAAGELAKEGFKVVELEGGFLGWNGPKTKPENTESPR